MIQRLVTAGCSFTMDWRQRTWADYLSTALNLQLVNVGARGAGMSFVSRRAMMALEEFNSNDTMVAVMLPSSDRFDYYVDSRHVLASDFVSDSCWQNGGPALVGLDGTIGTHHGYSLTGGQARGHKKHWYKYYYNTTAAWIDYWFDIVNLQNYLRLRRFKYHFIMAYDLYQTVEQNTNLGSIEYDDMLKLVDFSRFVWYQHQRGFLSFVHDHKFEYLDRHPGTLAHENFVEQVLLPAMQS